jgi:hypothetical protein
MGRKPRPQKSVRLPLTIMPETNFWLDRLVETGGYGNNATDAARTIIAHHLQELDRTGRIKLFGGDKGGKKNDKE